MRATSLGQQVVRGALLGGLAALALGSAVLAANQTVIEGCVVERKPDAALMTPGDQVLFELDLRGVPGTPFALKPGECVTISGLDHGSGAGLRREFPQGSWLVEAQSISAPSDHSIPSKRSNSGDD